MDHAHRVAAALLCLTLAASADNLRSIPVRHGLVGAWGYQGYSNSSFAIDVSRSGNIATCTNNAAWTSGAFVLDGTGDFLWVAHDDRLLTASRTICAWVKLDVLEDVGVVCTPYSAATSPTDPYFEFGGGIDASFGGRFFGLLNLDGAYQATWIATDAIDAGVWYHLALTWDGVTLATYIDGELAESNVYGGGTITHDGTPSLCIGAKSAHWTATNGELDGQINEVPIYNRALTAAEIKRCFAEGKRRHP